MGLRNIIYATATSIVLTGTASGRDFNSEDYIDPRVIEEQPCIPNSHYLFTRPYERGYLQTNESKWMGREDHSPESFPLSSLSEMEQFLLIGLTFVGLVGTGGFIAEFFSCEPKKAK